MRPSRPTTNRATTGKPKPRALAEPRVWRAQGDNLTPLAVHPQALGASYVWPGPEYNAHTEDGIAVVTVRGPLNHHAGWWWDSYEAILVRVEAAMTGDDLVREHEYAHRWDRNYEPMTASPARAVVLCLDSPGGEAAGATYAHRELRRLRAMHKVPLYAYANEMACSAAYELACAADELWLPDTGVVGSVGVIATMFSRSAQNAKLGIDVEYITSGEYKADGHPDQPITDDMKARTQARVNEYAAIFFEVVAAARGTTPKAVAGLKAATFCGEIAVDVGLADGVASWDAFLRTVTRTLNTSSDDSFDAGAADAA